MKYGTIRFTKDFAGFKTEIQDADFSSAEMVTLFSHVLDHYMKECRQEYILHSGIEEPSKEDLLAWIEFQQSIGL